MKIVVICWLHTGDPDVQESQACPQTQYTPYENKWHKKLT